MVAWASSPGFFASSIHRLEQSASRLVSLPSTRSPGVRPDCKDLKDFKDFKDSRAQPVRQVPQVSRATPVPKVHPDPKDLGDHKDPPEHQVPG